MTLNPDGTVNLDAIDPAQAIVDCGLCDDDGYRGVRVCDHIDHRPAAARGMAKIREILGRTQ